MQLYRAIIMRSVSLGINNLWTGEVLCVNTQSLYGQMFTKNLRIPVLMLAKGAAARGLMPIRLALATASCCLDTEGSPDVLESRMLLEWRHWPAVAEFLTSSVLQEGLW